MSYDLIALPLAPHDDFEEAVAELESVDDRPPTPPERAAMEALADALHAVDPAAERTQDVMYVLLDDGLLQVDVRNGEDPPAGLYETYMVGRSAIAPDPAAAPRPWWRRLLSG